MGAIHEQACDKRRFGRAAGAVAAHESAEARRIFAVQRQKHALPVGKAVGAHSFCQLGSARPRAGGGVVRRAAPQRVAGGENANFHGCSSLITAPARRPDAARSPPGGDEGEIPAFVGFPDEILQRPAGAAGIIAVDGELEAIVDESLQNFSGEAGAEDEKVLADGALVQHDARRARLSNVHRQLQRRGRFFSRAFPPRKSRRWKRRFG